MNSYLAVALSVAVAASYVVAIHWRTPAALKGRSRDNVAVIRHRFRRVGVLTTVLCVAVPPLVQIIDRSDTTNKSLAAAYTPLHLLPQSQGQWADICRCMVAVAVLYCGPILHYVYNNSSYIIEDVRTSFLAIHGVRDHVFAPVTEELIYRSVLVSVLAPNFTTKAIVRYGPLLFGIAHLHHGYDLYFRQKTALASVVATIAFQLAYTTVFGMLASYVFLKYQNVWCAIVVHAGCNLGGFPQPVGGSSTYKLTYVLLLAAGTYGFYHLI